MVAKPLLRRCNHLCRVTGVDKRGDVSMIGVVVGARMLRGRLESFVNRAIIGSERRSKARGPDDPTGRKDANP